MYLRNIETLICRREMSLIGSTSFNFAQNTIHDFSKYRIELIVALSSTNATKTKPAGPYSTVALIRSHVHRSPGRFHGGLYLPDDPGCLSPLGVHEDVTRAMNEVLFQHL